MADLVAQGAGSDNRWRRALEMGAPLVLGRGGGGWSASWDDRISREHAELVWDGRRLSVRQLPAARNPIFFKGRTTAEFAVAVGEHFVIGETSFTLTDDRVNVSLDVPQPVERQTFSAQYLRGLRFRQADVQIEVLTRLPDVISDALSDSELHLRLVNLMLAGAPRAGAVALVAARADAAGKRAIEVLHWDRRLLAGGEFRPSQRLILEALRRGESVLHLWNAGDTAAPSDFTISQGVDWAFCTPIEGRACQGWGIYVAGRFLGDLDLQEHARLNNSPPFQGGAGGGSSTKSPTAPQPQDSNTSPSNTAESNLPDLADDLKFTELAAATLGALCDLRMLERQRAGLAQFFTPVVLEAMAGRDPDEALAPREAEVTVLFCDLRGFTRESERSAGDLLGLLRRVSQALGVTTHHLRAEGGVLADFQGDAVMGFWGWPLADADAPLRACRTALAIQAEFAQAARRPDDHLSDFRMGIGIATGKAVAGKIGTADQVQVTVFGPVVNLASRLEGMTKILQAPILLDGVTAEFIRTRIQRDVARLRRVAVVKPLGFERAVAVTELLPPAGPLSTLSDEQITHYERALDELLAGRWNEATDRLARLQADDSVKEFLSTFIAQHGGTPPSGWNGVIALTSK